MKSGAQFSHERYYHKRFSNKPKNSDINES